MTGKKFSEALFLFTMGTKVKLKIVGKAGMVECKFNGYGIISQGDSTGGFAACFNRLDDGSLFRVPVSQIEDIDYADEDEALADLVRKMGKECISVCEECGSVHVEIHGWVDANTEEYCGDDTCDRDDFWCDECQEHNRLTSMFSFEEEMDNWAKDNGIVWEEGITYNQKREIYNARHKS